jgi:hypothetical protein
MTGGFEPPLSRVASRPERDLPCENCQDNATEPPVLERTAASCGLLYTIWPKCLRTFTAVENPVYPEGDQGRTEVAPAAQIEPQAVPIAESGVG